MVFEDDAIFTDNALSYLRLCVPELRTIDWNVFYLGGHRWGQQFPKANGCQYIQRSIKLTAAHALVYNQSIYDQVLKEVPGDLKAMRDWVQRYFAIDQYLPNLDRLYISVQTLATQAELISQEAPELRDRFTI